MSRRRYEILSRALSWVAVLWAACTAPLAGRPCTPEGTCLPGFRCRPADRICVAAFPESCDGEDNDGNGLVDEDTYRASVRSVPLALGETLEASPVMAMSAGARLVAWATSDGTSTGQGFLYRIRTALLDRDGALQDGPRSVAAYPTFVPGAQIAVTGTPTGFLVAYLQQQYPTDPSTLRLVRLTAAGVPSPAERVVDLGTGSQLQVGWGEGAPVFAFAHSPTSSCGSGISCELSGVFLQGVSGSPVRLGGEARLAGRPVALAVGPSSLATGWIEGTAEEPSGRVVLVASDATSTVSVAGAALVQLAWEGERLHLAWYEENSAERRRIGVGTLDGLARWTAGPTYVAEVAVAVQQLGLVVVPAEVAVVWSTATIVGASPPPPRVTLVRADPTRGAIGAAVGQDRELARSLAGVFAGPAGYEIWLAPTPSELVPEALEAIRLGCPDAGWGAGS